MAVRISLTSLDADLIGCNIIQHSKYLVTVQVSYVFQSEETSNIDLSSNYRFNSLRIWSRKLCADDIEEGL